MKTNMFIKIMLVVLMTSIITAGCGNTVEKKDGQVPAAKVESIKRNIVDMAGRNIEIPENINKVYATSQIGIIALYSLAPDKLAGWGYALSDSDKGFILEKYHQLPVLGVWSGKNGTGNIEEIIRVHPDVIFSIGTIDESQKTLSNKIQEQTGIPVIMLDAPLNKLDKMYEMLGNIIDEKDRAKELGDYCSKTITGIEDLQNKIPNDKRVKVYYAEGPKGLETDPKGSFHTEVLDLVGGINVAEVPTQKGFGRSSVSMEQLLKWDPDFIIVGYDKDAKAGFFKDIYNSSEWQDIKAVKGKKVYSIPNKPFDWFDRPPSVNRIIGVQWLANLLYPEYIKIDIANDVKDFYEKFYHKKLTDQEVSMLLSNE